MGVARASPSRTSSSLVLRRRSSWCSEGMTGLLKITNGSIRSDPSKSFWLWFTKDCRLFEVVCWKFPSSVRKNKDSTMCGCGVVQILHVVLSQRHIIHAVFLWLAIHAKNIQNLNLQITLYYTVDVRNTFLPENCTRLTLTGLMYTLRTSWSGSWEMRLNQTRCPIKLLHAALSPLLFTWVVISKTGKGLYIHGHLFLHLPV